MLLEREQMAVWPPRAEPRDPFRISWLEIWRIIAIGLTVLVVSCLWFGGVLGVGLWLARVLEHALS